MGNTENFIVDLDHYVREKLSSLDLLKEEPAGSIDQSEVVRRLKMALKNELEASELAAGWIATTPEVEVKIALARQAGDEARHYTLIQRHLEELGVDLAGFNPVGEGYGPMFNLLKDMESTVERVAAAHFTREALALKKNEQFIDFCEQAGAIATAQLYRQHIQPDEKWHVELGHRVLARYATSQEMQSKARRAAESVLDLAVRIQRKQVQEMKVSHAPGC